jgi:transposase
MPGTTVGIDLAKQVFPLYGEEAQGKAVLRQRLSRAALKPFLATLPPCRVGMEACGGAHYWAREFQQPGHEVHLSNPTCVQPFVKSNQNDERDAEAICAAVSRPNMRFVPVKTVAQQDIQALHRVRSRLVGQRTALVNQIRGLLAEYGLILPQQISHVRRGLPALLEDTEKSLTALARELGRELYAELIQLDERVERLEKQLPRVFRQHASCQRRAQVEGVGVLTATALVAAVSDPTLFRNGREFAAWLGLVPRQPSSGGKTVLLGIRKRGDRYLRTRLIHGARAAVYRVDTKSDPRSRWVAAVKRRRGLLKACVALANKKARIAWALRAHEEPYRKAA